ncbi:hypothetical protein LPJ61_002565 [Coemansia biformis]|uniref:Importin N-terminal domain-containing protein n=1 Tax=Coemansia biformis TaxID=1286918 RepID=A0A9W7YCW2_9FUNG|nr:hypothetical protein LPJ61_002565 [Coemansia biformis]
MALEGLDLHAFVQALSVPTQEALGALAQIQRQPAAWQLAFDLLATNDANCRFYGAHTLQAKIAHDWDTLDDDRQEALRGELIRLVVESCDGPASVLKKANQALATYALITVPARWENFLPSVIDAIQERARETGKAGASAGVAILDLLELFPEELNRAVVASSQHGKLVQDIKVSLPVVLQILTAVVRGLPGSAVVADAADFAKQLGLSPEWRVRAWRAILQWLQFGISGDTLFIELLEVCIQQLQTLAAHQLSGGAHADSDEIAAASAATDDMLSNMGMAAKYARSVGTLVLERFGEPWASQVLAHCVKSGSDQDAMAWSAMLISFGETYTEFIVSKIADPALSEHVGTYLHMMLVLTRFPGCHGIDEGISDQPLNFWYLLQEALTDYEYDADADSDAARAVVAATRAAVGRAYVELLKALVSKCAFPSAAAWMGADKDERDRFMSYRREAGDAMLNVYYVLREDMLRLLVDEVLGSMDSFSMANWQHVESLLFALRSIGEAVPESEDVHLPRLFSAEALASRFMPVVQASVDGDRSAQWGLLSTKTGVIALIGAFSEWWRGHPELLSVVVPCVTSGLSQPALVQAAVAAFRRICESCREQLTAASESMVHLACDVLRAGAAVPAREQQRIFESVAEVVMALPPQDQAAALAPITTALLVGIYDDLASVGAVSGGGDSSQLTDRLRLVDALARGLQFPDEVEERALAGDPESVSALALAAQCYQLSAGLCEFRGSLLCAMGQALELPVWARDVQTGMVHVDDDLLECLLSVVNNSARRGPHAFMLAFGDAAAFVGNAWSVLVARRDDSGGRVFGRRWSDQCPALLQCISQLATVFSAASDRWHTARPSMAEIDQTLGTILGRVIGDTCAGIAREAATPAAAVEQQPVIVEYLFDLCTRALQTRPELLVCCEQAAIGSLCELSTQALLVPSRLALKPTAYFLAALIRLSGSGSGAQCTPASALLLLMWNQYGAAWLRATLAGIGGMHPRSLLPNLAELLFAMAKNHLATTRQWMAQLLSEPEFPSPHADGEAKRQFMRQVLSTRSFVRVKSIVGEFSTKCRNIHGTAYAD